MGEGFSLRSLIYPGMCEHLVSLIPLFYWNFAVVFSECLIFSPWRTQPNQNVMNISVFGTGQYVFILFLGTSAFLFNALIQRAQVPASIKGSTATPSLSITDWGAPSASYPNTPDGCNIPNFFTAQTLVLEITLCGDWWVFTVLLIHVSLLVNVIVSRKGRVQTTLMYAELNRLVHLHPRLVLLLPIPQT